MAADSFEYLKVVFKVRDELRAEILCGQFFSFLFLQQADNAFLVIVFEQFKDLSDVLLANKDMALAELRDDPLVGDDEAV
jgi:hypothetical protein